MPTTCATATETREAPDRPQVLVRTTQFLKKVSNFRTASRKGDSPSRPSGIARAAQSMDLSSKVETKLEVRPHSFDQSRDSGEDSPSHLSLRGSLNPNRASSSTTDSRIAPPLHQIDGLPRTAYGSQVTTTTTTAPASIPSHTRSQTLPSGTPNDVVDPPHNPSARSPSTIGPSSRRALAPRLATLPPPLMAQYTAGGSARLTPSWVTRQPPMPLLNLPTLPPPVSPHQPDRPSRPTAPLRSMPALPMQGPSDTEQDGDHEDASVEDEDEEEDGDNHAVAEGQGPEGDSDDSEDDSSIPSASSVAGPSRIPGLPEVDTSRFSISFRGTGLSCSPHASPRASPFVDYFTSKPPDVERIDHTPRPSDFRPNGKARALPELEPEVPLPRIVSMPRIAPMPMPMFAPALSGSGAASHPNMYRHASKSMIDIVPLSRKDKDKVFSPRLGRATPKIRQDPVSMSTPATETTTGAAVAGAVKEPEAALAPEPPAFEPDDVIQSSTRSTLRRRRSLPVYKPSSDPPPYPDPWFRRRGQVAGLGMEEEGTEQLPGYSNMIHLVGVMPRKMEFTAPGMQARDRKWRRVYCVLEGTAFRVFKCPPAASRVGALEQWWERKVGAGDFTSTHASAVTASGVRVSAIRERERLRGEEDGSERIPKIVEEPTQMRTLEPEEPQEEPRRQRERRSSARSPSTPPVTKSRLGLTSRFLHRQRSKSSSRTLSSISASMNESTGSSARLSMDSGGGGSEGSRHRSRSTTRDSMDIVESPRSSVASGLTIPAASPTSEANERPSRRRSILSQSTLGSSSSGGSFPEQADRAKGKGKGRDCGGYMPDVKKDLLQQYSLQNAESGLASDYLKRKNVIRLRMEGQQFLLQAKDVGAVIDWIEGIQMGTNVALDIDDRPMPRGPIFPRRRRRRARRPEPESAGAGAGGGSIASAGS
uniref:Transcriptional repressor TUP1 n=1 Tax=Ganoderma boninense TaxID=34458 RepID=A0A5K1JUC7_9APHY|nr:Transcriptional repressor TUP1 [Ganoderma boninense]